MMSIREGARWKLAVTAVTAMLAGSLTATSAATAQTEECPDIIPISQVSKGMTGTGLTVRSGTEPTSFGVEVLGVLPDAIGPGKDLIIIDAHGPVIDDAGIWSGMSGSPVYLNGKLAGAVAYGLTWGPSTVGGVTPSEDMVKILGYPTSSRYSATPSSASAPRRVALSSRMRRSIAEATGTSEDSVGGSMSRLRAPLSVSGLSERAFEVVQRAVARERLRLIPYAGSSAAAAPLAPGDDLDAGDSFAAALSYGDVTFAGVGTTTFVCYGKALAFGHPFFFEGDTRLGANNADAIGIVTDPAFGSYKLATVTSGLGTVDQDRLSGIRAILGQLPTTIPIASRVTVPDLSNARDGETGVVTSEYTPFLAFIHMLSNIDVTFDEIGSGSAKHAWRIHGTRENGDPWTLARWNLYTSDYDIAYDSLSELLGQLYRIFYNDFEQVEFTGVSVDSTVEQEIQRYLLTKVKVSRNGGPFREVSSIFVRPGTRLGLRAVLQPYDRTKPPRNVDLHLTIPSWAKRDGSIAISGTGSDYYEGEGECFSDGEDCSGSESSSIDSFDELLRSLQTAPKNYVLFAKLRIGYSSKIRARDKEVLDQVVRGFRSIEVRMRRSGGGETVEGKY